jgi:hypothetical protein
VQGRAVKDFAGYKYSLPYNYLQSMPTTPNTNAKVLICNRLFLHSQGKSNYYSLAQLPLRLSSHIYLQEPVILSHNCKSQHLYSHGQRRFTLGKIFSCHGLLENGHDHAPPPICPPGLDKQSHLLLYLIHRLAHAILHER